MRSTCSLYVDAGYLLASAATRVTRTSLRSSIHVNYDALVAALISEAEERSGLSVLRVHWYDSGDGGLPDLVQERIGMLSKVKLRLGRFGLDKQQKGVDVRIALDLVAHARNGTSDVFYLISGDDDLTEAVEDAQVHGTQIVVMAVPNAEGKAHGVSRHLRRAADDLALLPGTVIDEAVVKVARRTEAGDPAAAAGETARVTTQPAIPTKASGPATPRPHLASIAARPAPPGGASATGVHGSPLAPRATLAYSGTTGGTSTVMPGYDAEEDVTRYDDEIDAVVRQVYTGFRLSASDGTISALRSAKPSIPSDLDRALLVDIADALGINNLPESIRFRLRDRFWIHVDHS